MLINCVVISIFLKTSTITSRKCNITKYESGPCPGQNKKKCGNRLTVMTELWRITLGSQKMLQSHCYSVTFIFQCKMTKRYIFFWKHHSFTKWNNWKYSWMFSLSFNYHLLKGIIILIYTITRVNSQTDHCYMFSLCLTITILDIVKYFQ